MGVMGGVGSGKSVLMHLLGGRAAPDRGSVIYHMSACDHCIFMDVQSGPEEMPECGGNLSLLDVDLWDEKNDGIEVPGNAPDSNHVPAHVCPLR